jgi:hypothetical protein
VERSEFNLLVVLLVPSESNSRFWLRGFGCEVLVARFWLEECAYQFHQYVFVCLQLSKQNVTGYLEGFLSRYAHRCVCVGGGSDRTQVCIRDQIWINSLTLI